MADIFSKFELQADVKDFVNEVNAATGAVDKFTSSFTKLTSFTSIDKGNGQLQTMIEGFDKFGRVGKLAINSILDAEGTLQTSTTETVKKVDKSLNDLVSSAAKASKKFQTSFEGIAGSISGESYNKINTAIEKVANLLTDGLPVKKFNKLWKDTLEGNSITPTSKLEQKAVIAMRSLRETLDKEQAKLNQEAINKSNQFRGLNAAKQLSDDLEIHDPKLKARADRVVDRIRKMVESGKIQLQQFNDVKAIFDVDPTFKFSQENQGIARYLSALDQLQKQEYTRIDVENRRHANAKSHLNNEIASLREQTAAEQRLITLERQRADAVRLAQSVATGQFTGSKLSPSLKERGKFEDAIGASLTPVQQGTVGLKRYLEILDQVRTGRNRVFTDPVERSIASNIGKATDAYTQFGNEAKAAYAKAAKGAVDTSYEGKKAASSILLNWQSMLRLLEVQFLHVFISRIMGTMKMAVQQSIEFQKAVSEIRTISQSQELSFQQIASGARGAALETGFALKDITEGVYETTSNQIAKGNEAIAHIQQVGNFARAAAANMADSVNLIDGVLNAYGHTASQTATVSASLFKTIDLGRVRAKEIATSFGNVTSIAAELGIDLNEVNAAMARLTIQGVKPAVAMTLLENLMVKLIKPTDAMKDVLRAWGFESGQAAVAALGFAGVINKMSNETENNKAKFGELFNTMRGLRGVFGITNDMEKYNETLKQIKGSYEEFIEAQKRAKESEGFKLSVEFERIKTFITADIGNSMVSTLIRISDAIGGLSNVVKNAVPLVLQLSASFAAYKLSTTTSTFGLANFVSMSKEAYSSLNAQRHAIDRLAQSEGIRFTKNAKGRVTNTFDIHDPLNLDAVASGRGSQLAVEYNKVLDKMNSKTRLVGSAITSMFKGVADGIGRIISSINWAGLAIAAATYIYTSWVIYKEKLKTIREELTTEAIQNFQRESEAFIVNQGRKIDALNELAKKSFQGTLQFLASQNSAYEKSLNLFVEKQHDIEEAVKVSIKTVTDELQEGINKFTSRVTKLREAIEEVRKQRVDNQRTTDSKNFDLITADEENAADKVLKTFERVNQLKTEAAYIDSQRAKAHQLRLDNKPEEAAALESQFRADDARKRLQEAQDELVNISKIYVKGSKERERVEEQLAKAKLKQAQHVAIAEQQIALSELEKTKTKLLLTSHTTHVTAIRQLKTQIDDAKSNLKTLKANFLKEGDAEKVKEIVENLEKLKELQAVEIKFGGIEGLRDQLNGIATDLLKKIADAEEKRLQKQLEIAEEDKRKAVENFKQAQLSIQQLEKIKVVDARGNFASFPGTGDKQGLSFLNDITQKDLPRDVNQLNAFIDRQGETVASFYRKQVEEVIENMRKAGADASVILEFTRTAQQKEDALRVDAITRTIKKVNDILTRTVTDNLNELVKKNEEMRKTFDTSLEKISSGTSSVVGVLGLLDKYKQGPGRSPYISTLLQGSAQDALSLGFLPKDVRKVPSQPGSVLAEISSSELKGRLDNALNAYLKALKDSANLETAKAKYEEEIAKERPNPEFVQRYKEALDDATKAAQGNASIAELSQKYKKQLDFTITVLDFIAKGYGNAFGSIQNNLDGSTRLNPTTTVNDVSAALKAGRVNLLEASNVIETSPAAMEKRRKDIEAAVEVLKKYKDASDAANVTIKATTATLPDLVKAIEALGEAAKRNAGEINNLNPKPHAMGGLIGSDTELAALTKGEMVMNRNAVGQFYPLLNAINGQVSGNMALGGAVTMGDVNIYPQLTGNAQVDARIIGSELRTLIRQGVLNLS
jgi:TP901 family phage tail tape measure protein